MLRFLGVLFLLALLIGGVGFCRDWFTVTASGGDQLTFSVDRSKLKSDALRATETLGELSRQAAAGIQQLGRRIGDGDQVLEGTVDAVDVEARQLRVQAEGGELLTLDLGPGTAIALDGRDAELAALAPGDRVTIGVLESESGLHVARVDARRGG